MGRLLWLLPQCTKTTSKPPPLMHAPPAAQPKSQCANCCGISHTSKQTNNQSCNLSATATITRPLPAAAAVGPNAVSELCGLRACINCMACMERTGSAAWRVENSRRVAAARAQQHTQRFSEGGSSNGKLARQCASFQSTRHTKTKTQRDEGSQAGASAQHAITSRALRNAVAAAAAAADATAAMTAAAQERACTQHKETTTSKHSVGEMRGVNAKRAARHAGARALKQWGGALERCHRDVHAAHAPAARRTKSLGQSKDGASLLHA